MQSVWKKNQPLVNERGRRVGENHPRAKYSDSEITLLLELRDGGMGYKRLSEKMEMPMRTVRDICNGRRRCQTFVR